MISFIEQSRWWADTADHYNVSNDTVWPFADIRSIFYIRLTIIFHYGQVCVQSPHTIQQRWGKLFNIVMFAKNISAVSQKWWGHAAQAGAHFRHVPHADTVALVVIALSSVCAADSLKEMSGKGPAPAAATEANWICQSKGALNSLCASTTLCIKSRNSVVISTTLLLGLATKNDLWWCDCTIVLTAKSRHEERSRTGCKYPAALQTTWFDAIKLNVTFTL